MPVFGVFCNQNLSKEKQLFLAPFWPDRGPSPKPWARGRGQARAGPKHMEAIRLLDMYRVRVRVRVRGSAYAARWGRP